MRTVYVMDDLSVINVKGDSTYMMMLEANRRGWDTYWCTPQDLYAIQGNAWGKIQKVVVRAEEPFFASSVPEEMELNSFDVIWMRKDPPFDMDYIFSTYLLDLVGEHVLVLNDPRSLRNCNEKMFALQWPEFCPETLVTREIQRAIDWSESFNKVVIKPWDGNGGRGVLVTSSSDLNFRSMLELLTNQEKDYIIVQRYLPEIKEGDKRIILIDGEVVGQMLRVPGKKDHRGNMHVGASVQACELTKQEEEICAALKPILKKLNLLFVGQGILQRCSF